MISDGITINNDSSLSYITDEKGVTYLLSGVETIFYSRDYGLGYKLIAAIGGSLPEIHVKKPTVVLGPLEEPNVEINNDDINNPELQFYLPRATKFFFGNELGDNPNIETVVVYDPNTGEKTFEVIDSSTGLSVPNYPRPNSSLLDDTSVDISTGIASNTNIGQSWKIVVLGDMINKF